MKGYWQEISNCFDGEHTLYQVGRRLRQDEPLNSGNIEYSTDKSGEEVCFNKRSKAEGYAEFLNELDAYRLNCLAEFVNDVSKMTPEQRLDFAGFLGFCAERLEKGETVKEIWGAYQASLKAGKVV